MSEAMWTNKRWERRGFNIYLPGTQKRAAIIVPIAWKSSAEAREVACLVAAAPALVEALEDLTNVARNMPVSHDNLCQRSLDIAVTAAEDALAVAKGGQS